MREFCHFLGEFARHPSQASLTVFEAVRTSRGEKRPAGRPKWTQEFRSSHLGRRIGLLLVNALGSGKRGLLAAECRSLLVSPRDLAYSSPARMVVDSGAASLPIGAPARRATRPPPLSLSLAHRASNTTVLLALTM